MEEAAIVAKMGELINHDIYIFARVHTLEDPHDQVDIPEVILARRKIILDEVQSLVNKILSDRPKEEKQFTPEDYNTYVDKYCDLPEFAFMSCPPVTVNKGGWGYFAGLLNPLEYGSKFSHSEAASRISNWKSGR